MTTKLNSLKRWKDLPAGSAIELEERGAERRVRIQFNLESQTTLYAETADGPRLLCTTGPGLQTVEFSAGDKTAIFAGEGSGEVQYQTAEAEPTFARVIDPKIFTKIATRRHRNPELEEMMFRMQINMENRLATQSAQIEEAFARRLKEERDGRPAEIVETDAPGATAKSGSTKVPAQEPGPAEAPGDAGANPPGEPAGDGSGAPAPA